MYGYLNSSFFTQTISRWLFVSISLIRISWRKMFFWLTLSYLSTMTGLLLIDLNRAHWQLIFSFKVDLWRGLGASDVDTLTHNNLNLFITVHCQFANPLWKSKQKSISTELLSILIIQIIEWIGHCLHGWMDGRRGAVSSVVACWVATCFIPCEIPAYG